MNLEIKDNLFVVTGATKGFGKAVALRLVEEGAKVIINARDQEKIKKMIALNTRNMEGLAGDITGSKTIDALANLIGERKLSGIFVNAGGPPAKSFMQTMLSDWQQAYNTLLKWKVEITKVMMPRFLEEKYGRIVYLESVSVKQPVENLVLSNSLRAAVVGFVKTLAQEVASEGVTLNVLAPGFHATDRMDGLIKQNSETKGISEEEVKQGFLNQIPVKKMGDPNELANLAAWLLSPHSGYITGQTISVDGGVVKHVFG